MTSLRHVAVVVVAAAAAAVVGSYLLRCWETEVVILATVAETVNLKPENNVLETQNILDLVENVLI